LLELALALKFLSMADLYWHLGLLDREIFIAIWVAIFGAMSLYLLGKIRLSHDTHVEKLSVPRMVLSLVAISFVFYLIPGLWGSPLSKLSGILPPPNREIGVRIAPVFASNSNQSGKGQSVSQNPVCNEARKYADKLSGYAPDGYCMFYNLAEAQAYSRKVNKPIMIDFTGHTCANCRQMEHQVWPDQRVKKILTEEYVIASLYVDDNTELPETIVKPDGKKIRTVGDEYRDLQISNFRVFAQPYYFLTDADLNLLVPEGVGYTPDIDEYLAYLNKGLQNFRNSSKTSSNQ